MAISITRHALERYVERIKGVKDKNERNAYITMNRELLEGHIATMFEHAEFVFKGKIGGDGTNKNFYLLQDIAFVVSDENSIVTIFKINFEFPQEAQEFVIKCLVDKIKELDEQFIEEKIKVDEKLAEIDTKKEQNDLEIKELEARIKLLKDKNNTLDLERKNILQEVALIDTQKNRYAFQLFGNTDFKNDLVKK